MKSALQAIEKHFHAVINERAGKFVRQYHLQLPNLEELLRAHSHEGWFPVPGMYGGFKYWFDDSGASTKLICESWCRVVGGSGQRHEITSNGAVLVAEGFV